MFTAAILQFEDKRGTKKRISYNSLVCVTVENVTTHVTGGIYVYSKTKFVVAISRCTPHVIVAGVFVRAVVSAIAVV